MLATATDARSLGDTPKAAAVSCGSYPAARAASARRSAIDREPASPASHKASSRSVASSSGDAPTRSASPLSARVRRAFRRTLSTARLQVMTVSSPPTRSGSRSGCWTARSNASCAQSSASAGSAQHRAANATKRSRWGWTSSQRWWRSEATVTALHSWKSRRLAWMPKMPRRQPTAASLHVRLTAPHRMAKGIDGRDR